MLRVVDCVADRVRPVIPQPTEWQHRKSDQSRDDLCAGGLRKRELVSRIQVPIHAADDVTPARAKKIVASTEKGHAYEVIAILKQQPWWPELSAAVRGLAHRDLEPARPRAVA